MKIGFKLLVAVALCATPSLAFAKSGEVRKLDFLPEKGKSVFTVYFEGKGGFKVSQSKKSGSVVVEAANMMLPAHLTKLLDSSAVGGPVIQVTPYSAGSSNKPVSKFVLQLRQEVELSSSEVPGRFMLELKAKAPIKLKAGAKKPTPTLAKGGWSELDMVKNRSSAADKSEDIAKRLVEVLNAPPETKVYFGSRVTFEGSQVDVHDIFRLIGEASGLNIMTDKDVSYSSDFSVTNIPWDQLLDIVLDQAQLKAKAVGNVVRIVTGERYAKELEAKLREVDLADENEPVVMAVIPLSFATAEDVKTMIHSLLVKRNSTYSSDQNRPADDRSFILNGASQAATVPGAVAGTPGQTIQVVEGKAIKVKLAQDFVRGEIQVDSRSNSLIVTNTKQAIERIKRLVKELDVALPQVLIDAKVIIASEDFGRTIGVAWGGRGTSSGSGRAGAGAVFNGSTVTLGDGTDASPFQISAGKGADINGVAGFQVGAGRHGNLSAQLNLAELNGVSKTVASPRVIVNNKKTATIVDGQTLYFQTDAGVGANGTLTQVQAALNLTVTPQVTSAGSVLLDVSLTKDAPKSGSATPTIDTKKIETQVLVESGNTLVLGGVYQEQKGKSENGIPLLMNLPFIGQMFRTNSETDSKSELMVFLTPEIVDVKTSPEETTAL